MPSQTQPMTQPTSPVAVTPPQDSDDEPEENAFGIISHSGSRPAKRKCLQVAAAFKFCWNLLSLLLIFELLSPTVSKTLL